MSMPRQKPWESEQVVETPRDFLDAVESRYGTLHVDLACSRNTQLSTDATAHGFATQDNRKAPKAIVFPESNALEIEWHRFFRHDRNWLNPPFKLCGYFAEKCAHEIQRYEPEGRIFMLTPASVGSNWFRDFVYRKAFWMPLSPRLQFVGHEDLFPKDLMLTIFMRDAEQMIRDGRIDYEPWTWQTDAMRERRRLARVEDIDAL